MGEDFEQWEMKDEIGFFFYLEIFTTDVNNIDTFYFSGNLLRKKRTLLRGIAGFINNVLRTFFVKIRG